MYQTIKHCSIDLWFTLIKSNPVFKHKRALYFYKHINTQKKSLDEVEAVFRKVDLMCNAINEKTGNNICAEEMYGMAIYLLNDSMLHFCKFELSKLYNNLEELFFEFSPVLFNEETLPALEKIKKYKTLSILSNTAFIKASTLRKLLIKLDVEKYFAFQIYSDEVGLSKPNAAIFNLMLKQINMLHDGILPNQILHIGDNPIADIAGANVLGINTFQINTNDKIIANIFD
jgi:putative hydrolase of the HAD superfamily